jgi:hypothetical protein
LDEDDDYTIKARFMDSITNITYDTQTFNINLKNYSNILNNGVFTERKENKI